MAPQRDSDDPTAGTERRCVRRARQWSAATLPLVVVLCTLIASLAGATPPRLFGLHAGPASGPNSGGDARRDGDRKLLRSIAENVVLGARGCLLDPVGSSSDPQTNVTFAATPSVVRLAASSATLVHPDHRVRVRRAIRVGDPRAPPTSGGLLRPAA